MLQGRSANVRFKPMEAGHVADDDDDDDGTARRQLERLGSVVDLTKQSQQQQSWEIRVVMQ